MKTNGVEYGIMLERIQEEVFGMKTKEPIAILENELGSVAFQEQVFTSLVKESMSENPKVLHIQLNQLFGSQRGQKIQIATGEAADEVSLNVSVKLKGPVHVVEAGREIQERLITELEHCLGVKVTEIVLKIEDIVY